MIDFLTIILLIFGVLQIILFFKVWGMTNDIKDIRNKYLKDEDEKQRKNTEYDAITNISRASFPGFNMKISFVSTLFQHQTKTKNINR